jgi:hypothetical protein
MSKKLKISEALDILLKRAQTQGYIAQDDILELIPEPEKHVLELDEFYNQLASFGLDVFESVSKSSSDTKSSEPELS